MTDAVNHAQLERALLCDLFEKVGPDAPTLCEGWTTRDLAAHLVVREGRIDASMGLILPPLANPGEKVRLKAAQRPWEELVERVRTGPPRTSMMRIGAVDRAANTAEYFIHHEDVRRAIDGWEPRELDPDLSAHMWKSTSRTAKFGLKKAPCGVVIVPPEGDRLVGKAAEPSVEVAGTIGELVLFLSGRQAHARVELTGPAEAMDALRKAPLGL